jgi:hypothetical protein
MSSDNIKDMISLRGEVSIVLTDAITGRVKARRNINNLVVQGGKDLIAANFAGTAADTVTHIALGTNTPVTAAASSQTALMDPLTPRVSAADTVTTNPATIEYSAVFGPGVVTASIGEAGLFTASTGGAMVARTTFAAIPKGASDMLTITWTLIFG